MPHFRFMCLCTCLILQWLLTSLERLNHCFRAQRYLYTIPHWCSTYFNPVNKRSKEEHEELHCGHGVLEELPSVILLLIIRGAGPGMSWRSLVFSLVDKGATTPSPAGTSVSSKTVIAAVLRGLQQHPVKSVKQFCFGYTKLILMSWMGKTRHSISQAFH